jgi:hypothetical protein
MLVPNVVENGFNRALIDELEAQPLVSDPFFQVKPLSKGRLLRRRISRIFLFLTG